MYDYILNNLSSILGYLLVLLVFIYLLRKIARKELEHDIFKGIAYSSPIPSIYNFRDIGGLPIENSNEIVRKGFFYRSGSPTNSSQEDIEFLLTKLNIRTLVDLRALYEIRRPKNIEKVFEDHFTLAEEIQETSTGHRRLYRLPMISREFLKTVSGVAPFLVKLKCKLVGLVNEQIGYIVLLRYVGNIGLHQLYIWNAEYSKPEIVSVFRVLAYNEGPFMLFCSLGKDRTGTIIALLLDLLGVPREVIANDYAKSHGQISKKDITFLRKYFPDGFIVAKAESVIKFLDHIDKQYGSVQQYLESAGFSLSEQRILRARFVERKPHNKDVHSN